MGEIVTNILIGGFLMLAISLNLIEIVHVLLTQGMTP
jgi:hypothetical protein